MMYYNGERFKTDERLINIETFYIIRTLYNMGIFFIKPSWKRFNSHIVVMRHGGVLQYNMFCKIGMYGSFWTLWGETFWSRKFQFFL